MLRIFFHKKDFKSFEIMSDSFYCLNELLLRMSILVRELNLDETLYYGKVKLQSK